MRTLRQIIRRYMYQITGMLVLVILVIITLFQTINRQTSACDDAGRIFRQMEHVLAENEKELSEVKEAYLQKCLDNAEVIARILEAEPEVMHDVYKMRELAEQMEVDEIHVFSSAGVIFAGTTPEYFGLAMEAGEQVSFFLPMLEDKSLRLVQEIEENTAVDKPMQYSAVWSQNGIYIVQVGMEPVNVMKATEKNELAYIFSLLRVNPNAHYYAIDVSNGEIMASTDLDSLGKHYGEQGFDINKIKNDANGFHATVNGRFSYCVFEQIDKHYIGRMIPVEELYENIPVTVLEMLVCLVAVAFVLAGAVTRHMDKYVVDEIGYINDKMYWIAAGNLDDRVDVTSSLEFARLSGYINDMVKSLLDSHVKISYVLKKTNLRMGVYEYNQKSGSVQYTDYLPQLLEIEDNGKTLTDLAEFEAFISGVRQNAIPDEENVYRIGGATEKYVRLEETVNNEDVLGVVIDVTSEVVRRRKIEVERDIDTLTGLYNRRGLDIRLEQLFAEPNNLGYAAVVMIDADGLKGINDSSGHDMGDAYLKKIAEIIGNAGVRKSVVSRQGGDEFVALFYGYQSEQELMAVITELEQKQSGCSAYLNSDSRVPLKYSMGYALVSGEVSYKSLLKEADEKMYHNKMKRKKNEEM